MHRLAARVQKLARNHALVGTLLWLLGALLLGWTERADSLRVVGQEALGGVVLTGRAVRPGPAANGKLVLAVGAPRVASPARDPQFGVATDAPALLRKVAMFQWRQTRLAGRDGYEMDWFDRPIDSSAFAVPAGHTNPGAFPIRAARFAAPEVAVAGFRLASALVNALPGGQAFTPRFSQLTANMAATFQPYAGALVTSTNPTRPQIGDLRVRWLRIAPPVVTVFARDLGGTLVPARDPAGNPMTKVLAGRFTLVEVLTDPPQAVRFKWVRRALAVLLAWAGVALLLPVKRRRDRLLPLAAGVVPLALVAAVAWFEVDVLACAAAVFAAILAGVATVWRWSAPARGR